MRVSRLPLAALIVLAALVPAALAQTPGDCELGHAERELDLSDVRATLFNTGSLFFGNSSEAAYVIPKANGTSPIYAAGIWLGGTVDGELRTAAATYNRFEFWPGPLDDGATLPDADDCAPFDRIYVASVLDVASYEATGDASPDLAAWPVGLGAPAVDASGAPIVTSDRARVLDLAAGERPAIRGSQTAFWVMNDVGNEHRNTDTAPLGVEVAVTAFSVASDEAALDQATVYRYAVTNRSAHTIDAFAFGVFSDPDLGFATDDMVGVDTTRAMAFVYNASEVDSQYGVPPAVGYDFLDGDLNSFLTICCGPPATDFPVGASEYYNRLLGAWNDGAPVTERGYGYMTEGDETTFVWAGDPVELAFWSEENIDGNGNPSGTGTDMKLNASTTSAPLAPGATRTVDLAIVFGQGSDRLDSITALRAASDRVQTAYDDGSLFDAFPVLIALAAPQPVAPADGGFVDAPLSGRVTLSWEPVAGATRYAVQFSSGGEPLSPSLFTSDTELTVALPSALGTGTATWRVRAEGPAGFSLYSELRTFGYRYTAPDFLADGRGIVEVARPAGAVCPSGSDDYGCAEGLGNTVWLDGDAGGDYAVTPDRSDFGRPIEHLRQFVASAAPGTYEMRFSDGEHYGLRLGSNVSNGRQVWSVPFELWALGDTPDDTSDDVRMIPMIINPPDESVFVWEDSYAQEYELDGVTYPATPRTSWMMPDRPGGYALFAQAAAAAGVGGVYVDTDTEDTPIDASALLVGDVDPTTGQVCDNTGGYMSFCYRNDQSSPVIGAEAPGDDFVQPVPRMRIVDLAGDGTTPPSGTVIRVNTVGTNDYVVADESSIPETAGGVTLLAVRPNPSRGVASVPFELAQAGAARVVVVDVLGREVAVLVDQTLGAGAHDVRLDASALASGVYVVVLEAGGERVTRTVTVAR